MSAAAEPSPFAQAAPSLSALGYRTLPIIPPSVTHNRGAAKAPGEWSGGGWRGLPKWQEFATQDPGSFRLGLWMKAPHAGVGLLLGTPAGLGPNGEPCSIIALDIDSVDNDVVEALKRSIPSSPMSKVGSKGITLMMRAPAEIVSRSYDGDGGRILDLLALGRQTVVPPSVNGTTGRPYTWVGGGPVAPDQLPYFGPNELAVLEEALEIHAGWERPAERLGPDREPRSLRVRGDYGGDPWAEANGEGLARVGEWFADLNLPGTRRTHAGVWQAIPIWRESGTGRPTAMRKSSLSASPGNASVPAGIIDFGASGPDARLTAVDLAQRALGVSASEALDWLRARLQLDHDDDGVVIDITALLANAASKTSAAKNHAVAEIAASWAKPFAWIDPASIPPREWLYNHHLIRKFVSATFSPGGVGKSSLKLVEAMAMASGKPLLGVKPVKRLRVAYWNGEDPFDETQRRAMAIALHYGLRPEDLEGWLFLGSGREAEIVIAQQAPSGATIMAPVVEAITTDISTKALDVVIVDPFVSCHRVTENDNGAVDLVAKTWGRIADATGTAVELVHHTRKTNGAETTAEDGRGASSLLAAVRSAQVLNLMTKAEADGAGVDNHFAYFRADNGKANLAPRSDGATWYHFVGVDLGNAVSEHDSDKVGVVTAWSWPDAFDGVSVADLRAVQARVDEGVWRENIQATDWVGKAVAEVMSLDLDDRAAKQKVKGLLATWLKSGALVRVTVKDEKRRERPVIEVGRWVETN